MIDIATLITICQAALTGGSKVLEKYQSKKLSNEEKELLIAASKNGRIHLLSVEQISGTWVRAGGIDFVKENDPSYTSAYLEAFHSLCKRGFVAHEKGILFILSGAGFKKSKELTA